MIDIGRIIIQKAHEQSLSIAKLAATINLTTQALYKIIHREDLKVSRLLQLSHALNHDLFQYYRTTPQSQSPEHIALKAENKQLKQQLETLQRENTLLHDFVQLLKSTSSKA